VLSFLVKSSHLSVDIKLNKNRSAATAGKAHRVSVTILLA